MRRLGEVLVRTGRELFHEITAVAMYSLASTAVLLPLLFFVPTAYALALLPVLYAPAVYGACYAYHQRRIGERTGFRTFVIGYGRGFWQAATFGVLCALLLLILVSTWWYYGGREGIGYLAICVFQTYFVGMAFVSQTYTLQLVVQKDIGIFRAMGESVKLLFRYPVYTIGAWFQGFALTLTLLITVVGYAALWAGTMAIYSHHITSNVLGEEGEADEEGSGS